MKAKPYPWILVLLWMFLIFHLSHQPATKSNKLSKGATEIIVETVEKVRPQVDINKKRFNHLLRKNSHFLAYLVLGFLVAAGLRSFGLEGYKLILLALLISIVYAISDEVHQLFVPGRGGQVKDVIIDSAGSFTGIAIYYMAKILYPGYPKKD